MKDKTLVIRGLALFAAGDVQGAVRSWLAAKRTTGTSRQIETYLEQARRVAPAIVLAAEAEGGLGGKAKLATCHAKAVRTRVSSPLRRDPVPH